MTYRRILLGCALIVVMTVFLQHFEYVIVPCDSGCAKVRAWPLSGLATVSAVLAVLGLIYLEALGARKVFSVLACAAASGAIALFFVMLSLKGYCYLCLILDGLLIGLALSSFRSKILVALSLLPVAISGLILGEALYSRTKVPKEIPFRQRHYEPDLKRNVFEYLIFSDPSCPACRELARAEKQITRSDIRIRYRWLLLGPGGREALRAAIAIEAASEADFSKGSAFRLKVFTEVEPLSDENLVTAAASVGLSDVVAAALDNPPDWVLGVIADDADLAKHSGFEETPTVMAASKPDNLEAPQLTWASPELIFSIVKNQRKPGGKE